MSTKTYIGMKACDMGFDAHLTIHYLGALPLDQEEYLDHWLRVLPPQYKQPAYVTTQTFAMFGPNNDTPVVTVEANSELFKFKCILEQMFPSPSQYGWNPHITLKFDGTNTLHIPKVIKLIDLGLY